MTHSPETAIPPTASSPKRFSIEVSTQLGTIHLSPVGELDIATVGQLQSELDSVVKAGIQRVVIDLRQVEFIDSTGLHALLTVHARAKDEGWQLAIVPGRRAVQRLFELAGAIDRLPFTIVDNGVSISQA